MFDTINYLASGNDKQKLAYEAITNLGIMDSLAEYHPVLCGTIPIGIDIAGSDLDIIMEVSDFKRFTEKAEMLYGQEENFKIKRLFIREGTACLF